MARNWFSIITNNTELIDNQDPRILEVFNRNLLWEDEQILVAFMYVRDMVIFTSHRCISIDVQKFRGRKIRRTFYSWKLMESFSVENCGGMLDGDHDIEIKFKGYEEPLSIQVKKRHNIDNVTLILSNAQRLAR